MKIKFLIQILHDLQASAPGSPSSKPSDHEADTSISENQKIKSENEKENSVKKEPEPESEFDVDAIIQVNFSKTIVKLEWVVKAHIF